MTLPIKFQDEVFTADGKRLGVAHHLYHREEEVDPDLEFYAYYLEIEDFSLGISYFVPTDYFAGRDEESGRVTLAVPMKTVLHRTWDRRPGFIVTGQASREDLPRD